MTAVAAPHPVAAAGYRWCCPPRDYPVTQQYIVGEFSALLGELSAVPYDEPLGRALQALRHEVEACAASRLHLLTPRALALTAAISWVTFEEGDMERFCRSVDTAVGFRHFVASANLLP